MKTFFGSPPADGNTQAALLSKQDYEAFFLGCFPYLPRAVFSTEDGFFLETFGIRFSAFL